jgi:hypothetical protein
MTFAATRRVSAAALTVCASDCAYADFQHALDAARPGDTILLKAGETFVGNFVLPAKSGSDTTPILIRSDAPDSALPADGVRLVPPGFAGTNTQLSRLARLRGAGGGYKSTPVLQTAAGAHNYRLQFLDVDGVAQEGYGTIIEWGNNSDAQTSLDVIPYGIVLDRVFVHGHPTKGIKRCIALNGAALDVLNSFISDCKAAEIDAQAIAGFNGPGPFKISNNYLEGSTENILFGGADPRIPNLIPSDIEITRNLFTKPVGWRDPILSRPSAPGVVSIGGGGSLAAGTHYFTVVAVLNTEADQALSAQSTESSVVVGSNNSTVTLTWNAVSGADYYRVYRGTGSGGEGRYMQTTTADPSLVYTGASETGSTPPTDGKRWNVKNLLELKSAQRVLIDGNVFEQSWTASQTGYAILVKPENQDGMAPWTAVRDITISNNIIRHVAGAIKILGEDYLQPSQHTTRVAILNNLVYDVSDTWGGQDFLLITRGPDNVTVDHNTIYQDHTIVLVDDGTSSGFVFTNNVARQNEYGIFGGGTGLGGALAAYFPDSVVRRNAFGGAAPSLYPADNLFPDMATFNGQFVNIPAEDFRLVSGSIFKGVATDGTDIGVNFAQLGSAMNGASAGAGGGTTPPPATGSAPHTGGNGPDLNGDSKPDLVWLNDSTRQAVVWYLGGSQGNIFQGWDWLSSASIDGWTIVGMRDFNGDGKPDLVWQNDATQQVVVWYLGGSRGNTLVGSSWLAQDGVAGWYVVATGDFNGDGKPDLVWQNDARQVVVWYIGGAQGNTVLWGDWLSSSGVPGWRVVGTGDFNGDGRLDLVWQNDWTRQAVVWYMGGAQGNTFLRWDWLSSTDVGGWTLVGTADFNGDGKPDLVWQKDDTRQLVVWYGGGAQGNSYLGWDWLASDPVPGWRVIAR